MSAFLRPFFPFPSLQTLNANGRCVLQATAAKQIRPVVSRSFAAPAQRRPYVAPAEQQLDVALDVVDTLDRGIWTASDLGEDETPLEDRLCVAGKVFCRPAYVEAAKLHGSRDIGFERRGMSSYGCCAGPGM